MRQGLEQLIVLLFYEGALGSSAFIIIINLTIGVMTLLIGLGLLRAKEWARLAWLAAAGVLLVIHCLFLVAI